MARKIQLNQVAPYFAKQVETLVKVTTFEALARVKTATPVRKVLPSDPLSYMGGSDLRNAWQPKFNGPYEAELVNIMEYAEPVCYGTSLPPSWKGDYKTRQGTVPGFPDLIAKELESWAEKEYQKIVRGMG